MVRARDARGSFTLILAAACALGASGATLPFAAKTPEVRSLWLRGHSLELAKDLEGSNQAYEQVVALQPEESHPYWRIARNHLRAADRLPVANEDGRRAEYAQIRSWAKRGAEVDPGCAECFLYQFIGLSSVMRIDGTLSSATHAKEMGELLERALALGPTHVDDPHNSEEANLYFAAGVFYKVLPDSRLAAWTLGVRGDRKRSREYYQKAYALTDTRIDYTMSIGSALLCEGNREGDSEKAARGLVMIERVLTLDDYLETDPIDRDHARILIAEPDRACDYSREDWRRAEGR